MTFREKTGHINGITLEQVSSIPTNQRAGKRGLKWLDRLPGEIPYRKKIKGVYQAKNKKIAHCSAGDQHKWVRNKASRLEMEKRTEESGGALTKNRSNRLSVVRKVKKPPPRKTSHRLKRRGERQNESNARKTGRKTRS